MALNTGFLRTRDGTVIQRAQGKRALINRKWAEALDVVVGNVMAARSDLRRGLRLDRMMVELDRPDRWLDRHDMDLRSNRTLGSSIDGHRQRAVETINLVLVEAGLQPLNPIGSWE